MLTLYVKSLYFVKNSTRDTGILWKNTELCESEDMGSGTNPALRGA